LTVFQDALLLSTSYVSKLKVKHLLKSTEQRLQAKMIPSTQPSDIPTTENIKRIQQIQKGTSPN
jgi:hypothetical protein